MAKGTERENTLNRIIDEFYNELTAHPTGDLKIIAVFWTLCFYRYLGDDLFPEPRASGVDEALAEMEAALGEDNPQNVILLAQAMSDSLGMPDRVRDISYSRIHAGRSIDKDIELAKARDFKAKRRLASASKDWAQVSWYWEGLEPKQKEQLERYLAEDKVSRGYADSHKEFRPENLEIALGLLRPELRVMSHRDIKNALAEMFPELKRDLKFNWDKSSDLGYKQFRDWLASKGLTKGGKGGRPRKE